MPSPWSICPSIIPTSRAPPAIAGTVRAGAKAVGSSVEDQAVLTWPGASPARTAKPGSAMASTGVCHQIANRILYPASIRVDRAKGYNRSFRFYGDYGADLGTGPYWPERSRCLAELGSGPREAARDFVPDGLREPEAAYVMQSDAFVEQSVQRMNFLLDRALGDRLDPGVRARVEQIVTATAAKQRELVLAFEDGKIAPETYLDAFNELVATDFAASTRCSAATPSSPSSASRRTWPRRSSTPKPSPPPTGSTSPTEPGAAPGILPARPTTPLPKRRPVRATVPAEPTSRKQLER